MEPDLHLDAASPEESAPSQARHATPLVSVLIRSVDRAFLSQALDSLALQTYPNIEVVVQAVRTGHRPLGSHCGAFPLRLIATDSPLPRSVAANRALEAARGDFLIFLDDDDWMMPGHIARLAEVLQKFPQMPAVYTGIGLVDGNGAPMGQAFDLPFDPIRQLAGNLTPIHAVLFRRQLLSQGCRFDETLDRLEDWDFWLQVARHGPMVHLPGISAVYRIHESSGVHNDAGPSGEAHGRIYRKWETSWTPQEVSQIMHRVWTFPDMETGLANARDALAKSEQLQLANQAHLSAQMACITQHAATIAQQTSIIAEQASAVKQLQDQNLALAQAARTLEAKLAHGEAERAAILNSRIWRATKPVRSLGALVKSNPLRSLAGRARRVLRMVLSDGWAGLPRRLMEVSAKKLAPPMDYREWARTCDTPSQEELLALTKSIHAWRHTPLISIVMPVYNPPLELLRAAIASIQAQIYPHWELCIADDASPNAGVWQVLESLAHADHRIKIVRRATNGHISQASNSALELASGPLIALMDNDDLLPPVALYWVAEAVNRNPDAKVIYSDEDRLDAQGERFGAYLKCDWNYTLFLGHNLISHLGVYDTGLVKELGGFRQGLEGSQDYDLALRCIEKLDASQIVHIPKVLYHWRAVEGSTALSMESKPYALNAAQRALQEHLVRIGSTAQAEHLPSLNYRCVRSLEGIAQGMTVVLVGSATNEHSGTTPEWLHDAAYRVTEVIACSDQGSAINAAIAKAQAPLIAVIKADLSPASPQALLDLVGYALESHTGAAAGTVRDMAGNLLSGGLILNPTTIASVLHKYLPAGNHGYAGRGFLPQELSAVSLDCMVMRKDVFEEFGGFDTDLGTGLVGAVAWCLRLRERGLKIIWCPEAQWTAPARPPSLSNAQIKWQRKTFLARYGKMSAAWLREDPAYHPAFDPVTAEFTLLAQQAIQQ